MSFRGWQGIIHKYGAWLPCSFDSDTVTLSEGNTPLIYSPRLSQTTGLTVYLKYEGLNPTASFKDRGMTVAVTVAKKKGSRAVLCASTGNTSASAAAYAAKAGMKCFVLLPAGAVAMGKLIQALMSRSQVIAVKGNFDDALNLAREVSQKLPIAFVNSINPDRIEGQKTGAFEICDVLGKAPDFHIMPVGNAGNITAYWKGYRQYRDRRVTAACPRMLGFEASGAAPIYHKRIIRSPETIATAIRIGNPASWKFAEEAAAESGGQIGIVSDAQIIKAYRLLAEEEGILVEPASAASVAGLLKLHAGGFFKKRRVSARKATAVCVLTGHGLKDPGTAIGLFKKPRPVAASLSAVLKEIRL